jgi:hypothetical protein
MTTLSKHAALSTLGLPEGDHLLRLHVEQDVISFEVQMPLSDAAEVTPAAKVPERQSSGFLKKWGGSLRKIEKSGDAWLAHINEKHLK